MVSEVLCDGALVVVLGVWVEYAGRILCWACGYECGLGCGAECERWGVECGGVRCIWHTMNR